MGASVAVALLLGGAACAGPGETDPPPAESTQAAPSGGVLRDADGQPARPAPDGVFTTSALGPLFVGMSAEEAEATGLVRWEEQPGMPASYTYLPSREVFIGGTAETGIAGFLVKDSLWATPEGIRVGISTTDDLIEAYADDLQILIDDYDTRYYLVRDGDFGYFFQPDPFASDDTIIAMVCGTWDAISRQLPNTGLVN